MNNFIPSPAYLAFKALKVCESKVYSPQQDTEWVIGDFTYLIADRYRPSAGGGAGIFAATPAECFNYMNVYHTYKVALTIVSPTAPFIEDYVVLGERGWRSDGATVLAYIPELSGAPVPNAIPISLYEAYDFIKSYEDQGYPQMEPMFEQLSHMWELKSRLITGLYLGTVTKDIPFIKQTPIIDLVNLYPGLLCRLFIVFEPKKSEIERWFKMGIPLHLTYDRWDTIFLYGTAAKNYTAVLLQSAVLWYDSPNDFYHFAQSVSNALIGQFGAVIREEYIQKSRQILDIAQNYHENFNSLKNRLISRTDYGMYQNLKSLYERW